jgi:8-oxo-dGTP pyrophosphatase MutT (NUDIX family)
MPMSEIATLRNALAEPPAQPPAAAEAKYHAAVALILSQETDGSRLLFIERAEHPNDPWSGHIAFPGGRIETDDDSPRDAAERETLEEVGLKLDSADCLGHLSDVTGIHLPVVVSGFVYGIGVGAELMPNVEVKNAFWIALDQLCAPQHQVQHTFHQHGRQRTFPAIDLLGPGRPLLWGLSYRLVAQLLHHLDRQIPPCDLDA